MVAAFGDDTDGWPGKTIEVWAENVMFQGRLVPGIKLMAVGSAPAAAAHQDAVGGGSMTTRFRLQHAGSDD